MIRRPPRSTLDRSSAASDVYKRQMIHSARIIPLDGRPHIGPTLKQWLGDTRGHFEGNTLVIETTNFRSDDGTVYQLSLIHISEPTRQAEISYAVFCLKKKKN